MSFENDRRPPVSFDVEHLKTLAPSRLADELFGEAHEALILLNEAERRTAEDELVGICWLPTEEHTAVLEEALASPDSVPDGPLPDDEEDVSATWPFHSQRSALVEIMNIQRLENDIDQDPAASQETIRSKLMEICQARMRLGVHYAHAYVRRTAMRRLNRPVDLGLVLLQNAGTGDEPSFDPGIKALREAIAGGEMDYGLASEGLQVLTFLMSESLDNGHHLVLKDDALDLIALMRAGRDPSGLKDYAILVASFAVLMRDYPPRPFDT